MVWLTPATACFLLKAGPFAAAAELQLDWLGIYGVKNTIALTLLCAALPATIWLLLLLGAIRMLALKPRPLHGPAALSLFTVSLVLSVLAAVIASWPFL